MQKENDGQLIYGIRAVMEAVMAGKQVERIFITRGAAGELMKSLKNLLKEKNIGWQEVPVEKLNRVTRNNHQDVVCFISSIEYADLSDVVQATFDKGFAPLILILDRITDVRNFGAIARTAECAGVDAIVIPFKGSAQITADAIKTSAGALNRIPVCKEMNLKKTVQYLQQSGLKVAAATEKGASTYYYKSNYEEPMAIIMGSEEDGVSPDLLKTVDELIKIPMFGEIGSLNVSVAAGILLYEVVRQRSLVK